MTHIRAHLIFPDNEVKGFAGKKAPEIWSEPEDINNVDDSVKSDLNLATELEIKAIRGIGNVLAARIVKFRNALGGFLVDEQLYDVYGLRPEVAERLLRQYEVKRKPHVEKISINSATAFEISRVAYISYPLALKIVQYRDSVGSLRSFDELTKLQDFPLDKIGRIKLYLTL